MESADNNENLSEKTTKATRLIAFCNSSLGIWFLSTIFIGFLTFTYQNWVQSVKDKRDKETQVRNLEIEINRRIFIFDNELAELSKSDTSKKSYPGKVEDAIRKINSKTCYVFESFKKRKTSSLLYELYALLPEKNKAVAYSAFEKMFLIEQFPAKINKKTKSGKANDYFEEIVSYTKTDLKVNDWSK